LFSANNTWPWIIGTINGKLYVVEGRDNTSNRVQEYDPVANTWTLRAAQSIDPVYNCGSAIINSKLYQFWGTRASWSVVPSTYEYDPVVNTWVTRSNMPAERNWSSASNSGNLGYVFGGRDNFWVYQNTMYEYNATTNTWATRLSWATASRAPSVNAVGKSVFIMGGELSWPNSSNQHSRYNSDTFLTTAVTGLSIGTAVSASEIFIKNTL
jgi:N-acetylneuraminic acid mutarotase